jgi:hypothetical protein
MRPMSGSITSWLPCVFYAYLSVPWEQILLLILNMLPTSPEYQDLVFLECAPVTAS